MAFVPPQPDDLCGEVDDTEEYPEVLITLHFHSLPFRLNSYLSHTVFCSQITKILPQKKK
jgi:hypothetical protein